jgi:hypothetical protein
VTCALTTPAWTCARRFTTSRRSIVRSRLVQIMTGACTGSVPPESPVPAPRGTKGICSAASSRITSATFSGVGGSTTTSGVPRSSVYPSQS